MNVNVSHITPGNTIGISNIPTVQAVKETPAGTIVSGTFALTGLSTSPDRITTSPTPVKHIYAYNHNGNNVVYWGDASVAEKHPGIPANSGLKIEIDDASKVYFLGTENNEIGYSLFEE